MKKTLTSLFFILIAFLHCTAQENTQIGSWSGHYDYSNIIDIDNDNKDLIYAASEYSIFSYNKNSREIIIKSKINGLSDIGISCMRYDKQHKQLIIGYKNANIDIIKNGKVINIPDILNSNIMTKKTIHDIYLKDKYAYLSCGFGIVVLDLQKYEVKDSYFIGPNNSYLTIYDLTYDNNLDAFYAATDSGIYLAPNASTVNLAYSDNWNKQIVSDTLDITIRDIEYFNKDIYVISKSNKINNTYLIRYKDNKWKIVKTDDELALRNVNTIDNNLYIAEYNKSVVLNTRLDTVFFCWHYDDDKPVCPNKIIIDNEGDYWVADSKSGLVQAYASWGGAVICPTGPKTTKVFRLTTHDDYLYALGGGFDASWVPIYNQANASYFKPNEWKDIDKYSFPELKDIYDIVDIAIDPRDNSHWFLASYGRGLIEIKDSCIVKIYNETNSPLQAPNGLPPEEVRIGGLKYDKDNNLWITNCLSNKLVHVLLANGNWGEVKLPANFNNKEASNITIDDFGQKWLKVRTSGTIYVINDNGTLNYGGDDKVKALNYATGNGNIPGQIVYTISNDHFGDIWIGTDQGVAVFYYPEKVFSGENFDAERIIINNEETANQPLLSNETVTKICIDFNNNKWISTSNSGVYYVSQHGTNEIARFDKDNSFLLSNNVQDIAINSMGEVFFSTDKGLCSYRNYTAEPKPNFDDIYAYPNPVRPDYTGKIAITGLKQDSHVRITDMEGKVVFTGVSDGGQIIWNGNDASGNRAAAGVYVVFAISMRTKEKATTKILFIK